MTGHDEQLEAAVPDVQLDAWLARYCTGTPIGQDLGVCDDPGCPKHAYGTVR
jgi:hypothetical protein